MQETLSKTFRIMGIYILAMVVVSAVTFLANTEPKINKAQFFGEGEGVAFEVRETEHIERIDTHEAEQSEGEAVVLPFSVDVNIITETERNDIPEEVHFVHQIIPTNSMAFTFGELERRKRYFISFCKRRCCRKTIISTTPLGWCGGEDENLHIR